ncbi:VHS domain-containing protein [Crucibulum laeve]|uniref:VHS domain-containing protein n=1 Tax=Crucibulum laeve TaxID=68775 RepID=A0A5C3M0Z8_9AGAR|nr:VHS domain-containing protein [Crucibulum laeve]
MLTSPTGSSWTRVSPLESLITRACDPTLHEPNYALNLEVADHINSKKANTPREAAMLLARLANNRNPHIAILALALLDTLVQSCGYPFHLQISTKEFLNELVRRFPERPPAFPGPVMSRILELIKTWKEGICSESRWKEDLGNIRDMHRLLTFKGYHFRDSGRQREVLSPVPNIKSAEELEEEDREAQSAKLQELIRRGTPRDLAAAQELMKALAGANPEAKPDYRAQALNDLNKLEQKVILMNEMLDNVDPSRGEMFAKGDVYDQVASILSSARPKIQKWISDAASEDSESLDTFLQINDQINTVLDRYESFKKGDYTAASNPIPAELSNAAAQDSLIDLDMDESSVPATNPSDPNDLASLFSSPPAQAQSSFQSTMGSINLGASSMPYAPAPMQSNGNGFGGPMRPSMSPPQQSGTPPAAIMLPGTPRNAGSPAPNYFGAQNNTAKGPVHMPAAGMAMRMGGQMSMMTPQATSSSSSSPQPPQPSNTTNTSNQQGKDPFADLAGLF